MSIEIHQPELEQRVRRKIQSGQFHDVDELFTKALDALEREVPAARPPKKNLSQFLMESPLRGSGLKLERDKSYPRPIDL